MRRTNNQYRPDLTSHAEMVAEIRRLLNLDALYPLSDTDVVKIAIEKMFSRAFPNKAIVRLTRKKYIPLIPRPVRRRSASGKERHPPR